MREGVFRPYRYDRLVVGIECDAVLFGITLHDGLAQGCDAARHGIPVIQGVTDFFDHPFDDRLGGRTVRVAHSHVDYIDARRARLVPQLVDHGKDIRREFLDPVELLVRREGHKFIVPYNRQSLTILPA
jgi:hypothetical protein